MRIGFNTCIAAIASLGAMLLYPQVAKAESTIACPAGTYDMVDWMTMDKDLRATKHLTNTHVLYTSLWPDKFWWVKHNSGNIWDTWLYDSNHVYWYLTEMDQGTSWDDPRAARNFKKAAYDWNYKVANRCQKSMVVSSGGWNDSSYLRYNDCNRKEMQNLMGAYYTLAGPYKRSLGGDLPANMDVLDLTHLYNCNTATGQCKSREVYWLSQRYGLVRWELFERSDFGQPEVLLKSSTFNLLRAGTKAPNFTCW